MVTRQILYNAIRGQVSVNDVDDSNIRFATLPENMPKGKTFIVFNYTLMGSQPMDMLGMMMQDTYDILVDIIAEDFDTIVALAPLVRTAIINEFVLYNTEVSGDDEILSDPDLEMFHSELRFKITFN